MIEPSYWYRAAMLPPDRQKALDGDTYWMDLDLGLRTHAFVKIRLHDYSCVERGEPGWLEAQAFALEELYRATSLIVRTYKDRLSHDRWVADVYVNGELLGKRLMDAGFATYTPM